MNKKMIVTQVKRELWENRVSFLYTPVAVSGLILLITLCMVLFANGHMYDGNFNFNYTSTDTTTQEAAPNSAGASVMPTDIHTTTEVKKFNILTSIMQSPEVFNNVVQGIMYANCALLYLVVSLVMSAYSLRCLFDDRKNKDILFWRSMPVSETTNVLVKFGVVLLVGPLIMLALNLIVTLVVFLFSLVLFGIQGISLGYLISSVIKGGAFFTPVVIFYELLFSLLMLFPIIGFAFFSSAFAKKTPFFIFASPAMLALGEKILNWIFGIKLGVIDLFKLYGRELENTKDAFILQHAFTFNHTMILPLIICVMIGLGFVVAAIWLRNNRYEI